MVVLHIERERRREERDFDGKISTLLDELNINKETVVVVKNGTVVSEAERCSGDDELQVLSVISGG